MMLKKILSFILVLAMVLSLAACGSSENDTDETTADEQKTSYAADEIAVSSENFSFTKAEASYAFFVTYNNFKNNYSESVDMYNIDTNSTLKDQIYHDDITWFKTIADETVGYLKELLIFCEAAKAEGMELDEEENKEISDVVNSWQEYSDNYYYDLTKLLTDNFNADVTLSVMKSYMEKETLGLKYREKMISSFEVTDAEIDEYFNENADDFYTIDYVKYTFDEDKESDPAARAAELAATTDEIEFMSYVDNYESNVLNLTEDKRDRDSCFVKFETKNDYGEFNKAAFEGAELYFTYTKVDQVEGQHTVYMLTRCPSREEYNSKDIRYILVNDSSYDTLTKAKSALEDIRKEWEEGDATDESFAALVPKYSEDDTTNQTGGLAEQLIASEDSLPEELIDWLFGDEAPEVGDTTIIAGQQTHMLIYYKGENLPAWKCQADGMLRAKKYNDEYNALSEKYPQTVNEGVVNDIDA